MYAINSYASSCDSRTRIKFMSSHIDAEALGAMDACTSSDYI